MKAVRYPLIFLVAAIGCGGGDSVQLAPVSGKVTLDGSPLVNVTVFFQPEKSGEEKAPDSFGRTDQDGRYTLEVVTDDRSGAVVGKHKVLITKNFEESEDDDPATDEDFADQLPARYNLQTTLMFEVPEFGTDEANFELASDK